MRQPGSPFDTRCTLVWPAQEQTSGDPERHGEENDHPEPTGTRDGYARLAFVNAEGECGLGKDLRLHLRGHRIPRILVQSFTVEPAGRSQCASLQTVLEEFLVASRVAPMALRLLPQLGPATIERHQPRAVLFFPQREYQPATRTGFSLRQSLLATLWTALRGASDWLAQEIISCPRGVGRRIPIMINANSKAFQ